MFLLNFLNRSDVNSFLLVVIIVFSLFLGGVVFFHNKKKTENKLFFIISILFCFWPLFGYLTFFASESSIAIFWSKLAYSTTSVFFAVFYFFFLTFLKEIKKFKYLNYLVIFFALFFVFLSLFTDGLINDIKIKEIGVKPIFDWGVYPFYIYAFAIFLFILFRFYIKYFSANQRTKKRIQYFFVGTLIFLFLNIVFNIAVPLIWETYKFHQFGNYSPFFFLGFTAYAIVKEQLFGVKIILIEGIISTIAILLFINIFVSKGLFEYIWNIGLFLIFLLFGFFLIRSVWRRMRAREKVQKYAQRLKKANKRLRELDEQKTEFISFAAHQLRSPLTSVKGFSSLILEGSFGKMPPKVTEAVQNIYDSTGSMINSVEDYLNITRIEQGRMEYDMEEFDLYEVAQAVVNELQPYAYKKKLDLSISSDGEDGYGVEADQGKIKQVINNLVDNAIKYTSKGSVKVYLSRPKNKKVIRLSVSDTGMGMSQKTIKKLFKKYSRAENTQDIQGSGLGLFIAKRMVEAQKGRIWAESKGEGKGSTFILELPKNKN